MSPSKENDSYKISQESILLIASDDEYKDDDRDNEIDKNRRGDR